MPGEAAVASALLPPSLHTDRVSAQHHLLTYIPLLLKFPLVVICDLHGEQCTVIYIFHHEIQSDLSSPVELEKYYRYYTVVSKCKQTNFLKDLSCYILVVCMF